ncbi:MAG: tetratricopeptide repeat protein [Prevotella sp.]|nr:tetratricopeptide repeat protein [Prevotella sp.]
MSFWKALFGGNISPEEEKENNNTRNFDLLKYDGVKAMRMGKADYAVKCFQEALKISDDLETRDYLSQVLIHTGQLEEALQTLEEVRLNGQSSRVLMARMGHIAYMMEDYSRLADIAKQAVEADNGDPHAYYMGAQAALGAGNYATAIDQLSTAVKLDESHADARLLRAQIYMATGNLADAQADTEWLLANTTDHEDVLLLAARLSVRQKRYDDALNYYNNVTETNPFNADAYRGRIKLRMDMGDHAGALEDMEHLHELASAETTTNDEPESVEQMMKRGNDALNPFAS